MKVSLTKSISNAGKIFIFPECYHWPVHTQTSPVSEEKICKQQRTRKGKKPRSPANEKARGENKTMRQRIPTTRLWSSETALSLFYGTDRTSRPRCLDLTSHKACFLWSNDKDLCQRKRGNVWLPSTWFAGAPRAMCWHDPMSLHTPCVSLGQSHTTKAEGHKGRLGLRWTNGLYWVPHFSKETTQGPSPRWGCP